MVTRSGFDPVWAPDGKRIAYRNALNGVVRLDVIEPDGSKHRRVIRRDLSGGYDWAPDGSRIVFGSSTGNDSYISVVRRDGARLHRLIRNAAEPAYSPDGRWIVFTRRSAFGRRGYKHCDDDSGAMLWIVPTSGGRPRQLRCRAGGRRICGSGADWQPLL